MSRRTLSLKREPLPALDASELGRVVGADSDPSGLRCLLDTMYDCLTVETGLECLG